MHHLTVSTGGVESQEAMRIAPEPFGDGSLHRHFLSNVELRGAVVGEQGNRNEQKAKSYCGRQPISHCYDS
jgi:hypothetical protein